MQGTGEEGERGGSSTQGIETASADRRVLSMPVDQKKKKKKNWRGRGGGGGGGGGSMKGWETTAACTKHKQSVEVGW